MSRSPPRAEADPSGQSRVRSVPSPCRGWHVGSPPLSLEFAFVVNTGETTLAFPVLITSTPLLADVKSGRGKRSPSTQFEWQVTSYRTWTTYPLKWRASVPATHTVGFTVKQPLRPWPRSVGTDPTTGTEPRAMPGPDEGPSCQEVGSPSRAVARLMGQRLSHRTCNGCLLNFTDLPRHCFHCDILPVFRNLQSLSVLIEHKHQSLVSRPRPPPHMGLTAHNLCSNCTASSPTKTSPSLRSPAHPRAPPAAQPAMSSVMLKAWEAG